MNGHCKMAGQATTACLTIHSAMRLISGLLIFCFFAAFLPAQQPDSPPPPSSPFGETQPANTQTPEAKPLATVILNPESGKEVAEARKAFDSGVKLKKAGDLEQAYDKFEAAAKLSPHSVDYVTAREVTRQQLAMNAINRGNKALREDKQIVAMAEFRRALQFDPAKETFQTSYQKLHAEIQRLFIESWDRLRTFSVPAQPQDPHEGSKHYARGLDELMKIFGNNLWTTPVAEVRQRYRGAAS